jgi:hypothetical protein
MRVPAARNLLFAGLGSLDVRLRACACAPVDGSGLFSISDFFREVGVKTRDPGHAEKDRPSYTREGLVLGWVLFPSFAFLDSPLTSRVQFSTASCSMPRDLPSGGSRSSCTSFDSRLPANRQPHMAWHGPSRTAASVGLDDRSTATRRNVLSPTASGDNTPSSQGSPALRISRAEPACRIIKPVETCVDSAGP